MRISLCFERLKQFPVSKVVRIELYIYVEYIEKRRIRPNSLFYVLQAFTAIHSLIGIRALKNDRMTE
ncbi:hypothetical protein RCL_jg2745.t1 [Rhizophagus clarus]|uniref:Uncharacterized protein n=1 Tax=Rhizophagus clarus TaxID=94130 RepID=A0A8H3M940_9GLOM|nr:hypothetical protein RCL_jg2745.t1 [Rhizophagus clarus]